MIILTISFKNIHLELTNNTIRSTGTTNPLQIDTIRKIAIASILTDRALQNGEVKDAADYSKMYQTFIKSGGLEEMVDMIAVMRSYEANQKILQAHDQLLEKSVNQLGSLS